jgi:hypothetical protein
LRIRLLRAYISNAMRVLVGLCSLFFSLSPSNAPHILFWTPIFLLIFHEAVVISAFLAQSPIIYALFPRPNFAHMSWHYIIFTVNVLLFLLYSSFDVTNLTLLVLIGLQISPLKRLYYLKDYVHFMLKYCNSLSFSFVANSMNSPMQSIHWRILLYLRCPLSFP